MDDKPERPDLIREMLTYDPVRYAALHSVPPAGGPSRSSHRVRGLVILLVMSAIPAAVFGAIISSYQHTPFMSSVVLLVFFATWALIFLVGAARSVLLRDR